MREAVARIDQGALRENLRRARRAAGAARVVAVVKADAYGHGIERVVPALAGADAFGVACIEEGVAVRAAGARVPVMLLEGPFEPSELKACAEGRFEVVVHDERQIRMLERARLPRRVDAWLKIDTGMHRLGVAPGLAARAWRRLHACEAVARVGLMTHLACADRPDAAETSMQLEAFRLATHGLEGERSIAASGALLARTDLLADRVRPGITLYGCSPFSAGDGRALGLEPAMTLTTRLVSVRRLRAGEAVGYGAAWRCPEDMLVGTAAIGYGDGYPRHAPSGTPVLVRGRRCALAGTVSMDMIGVDLRACPDAAPGDEVTLWGAGLPVEEVAARAGTIGYELLCNVGARVHFRVSAPAPREPAVGRAPRAREAVGETDDGGR